MEPLKLPATQLTPAIDFDYVHHRLSIRGESFPENVASFYGPVLLSLEGYLSHAVQQRAKVEAEFVFAYVNSASIKSLQQLFVMLNNAARQGAHVVVKWYVEPEDEMIEELGRDLLGDKSWLETEILNRQSA